MILDGGKQALYQVDTKRAYSNFYKMVPSLVLGLLYSYLPQVKSIPLIKNFIDILIHIH